MLVPRQAVTPGRTAPVVQWSADTRTPGNDGPSVRADL